MRLGLGRMRGGYEVWVNGRRVGGHGSVVPGTHHVELPSTFALGAPDRDERWTIAIRMYVAPLVISDEHALVLPAPRVGPRALIVVATTLGREELFGRRVVPFFLFAAIFYAVALNHVALYRKRRELRGHLFYAGVCAMAATWAATVAARALPLVDDSILVRLSVSSYEIGMAFLVEFTRTFLGAKGRFVPRTIQIWMAVLVLGLTFLPARVVPIMWSQPVLGSVLLAGLIQLVEMVRASWRGRHEARILVVGAAVLIAGIGFGMFGGRVGASLQVLQVVPLVGVASFIASMSIALRDQYTIALGTLEAAYEGTRRFVPAEFLEMLGRRTIQEVRKGDHVKRVMAVLFADIRSFTSLSEKMTPEETFRFVNDYLAKMEGPIADHGGVIDKYLGDGIMAIFPGGADEAVTAAIEMLRALDEFNGERVEEAGKPIAIGIGIHTGMLMAGTIGGKSRLACTVLSDAVNLAARVEGMTKLYGASLLVTDATYARLTDRGRFAARVVDRVVAKGTTEPVTLYEILDGEPAKRRAEKIASRDAFAAALAAYAEGAFERAQKRFSACRLEAPNDGAAALYVTRCEELLERGAPTGWDGVTRLETK
jgi:class 3 adenylate cyclase